MYICTRTRFQVAEHIHLLLHVQSDCSGVSRGCTGCSSTPLGPRKGTVFYSVKTQPQHPPSYSLSVLSEGFEIGRLKYMRA